MGRKSVLYQHKFVACMWHIYTHTHTYIYIYIPHSCCCAHTSFRILTVANNAYICLYIYIYTFYCQIQLCNAWLLHIRIWHTFVFCVLLSWIYFRQRNLWCSKALGNLHCISHGAKRCLMSTSCNFRYELMNPVTGNLPRRSVAEKHVEEIQEDYTSTKYRLH